jgi:Domain of unknown function (DUF4440)
MSRAEEPTKNDSAQVRALVNRQVQAWEKHDFAIAADDWLPTGELFFPRGHVFKKDMQSAILDYFQNFNDLKVTVKDVNEDHAHFVAPMTYAYKQHRKSISETATFAMALRRTQAGWRITGWAYCKQKLE